MRHLIARTAVFAAVAAAVLAGCTAVDAEPQDDETTTAAVEQATVVPDVVGSLGGEAAAQIEALDMSVRYVANASGDEVAAADAATSLVAGSYPEPGDEVRSDRTVTLFLGTDMGASAPAAPDLSAFDLSTDAGICAADAEITSLELNDALAPMLGYSAERDARTPEQDDAIRAYKNDAFNRACPERAS